MSVIDNKTIDYLSDTTLYAEACTFARTNPLPNKKQLKHLEGLAISSKNWQGLIDYINHQRDRDTLPKDCLPFYEALRRYLNDSKNGLYERVVSEFQLVNPENLTKNEAKRAKETWAQELAQEFITHLVAEALLQKS